MTINHQISFHNIFGSFHVYGINDRQRIGKRFFSFIQDPFSVMSMVFKFWVSDRGCRVHTDVNFMEYINAVGYIEVFFDCAMEQDVKAPERSSAATFYEAGSKKGVTIDLESFMTTVQVLES